MLALIGMILTLVLILVAFFGPWYSVNLMDIISIDIGLTTAATTGLNSGPLNTTMYIAIGALITTILALIGIAGVAFNFGKFKTMKSVGGIFGILTFLLALIAPLYFMSSALLEGTSIGFWNEYGGPGYGWYLMIVVAIIALISSLFVFKEKSATPTG